MSNQPIALYRTGTTTVVAHSAVCTHRGCTVDPAPSATLQCPCHGSAFRATNGSVLNGPDGTAATSIVALSQVSVQVVNGIIYLS